MGVEFRLGRQDHLKVEDFLARSPSGVSAIVLNTKAAGHQRAAAEVAAAAGVQVLYDPATERCTTPGYQLPGHPYGDNLLDVNVLAADPAARLRLMIAVIDGHPDEATTITPPHFLVEDQRSANLNVALAADTRHNTDLPVRATVILARRYGAKAAPELARQYAQAGIDQVELRITPLGGDNESIAKIGSVFAMLDAFQAVGLTVVLGWSGNIGQAAVALGHADHYSVGVGMNEQVNHAATISRQQKPPPEPAPGEKPRTSGAVAGIYLPGLAATVSRAAGAALLAHTDIRTRVGCRIDACGFTLDNPTRDVRGHYLHARTHEMNEILRQPAPWRATREIDRLQRAVELRDLVNNKYRTKDVPELKSRTLRSLIDDLQLEQAARTA